jgi:phosphohistidine phosphatase SixA
MRVYLCRHAEKAPHELDEHRTLTPAGIDPGFPPGGAAELEL